MKSALLAVAFAAIALTPALAADALVEAPVAAVHDWTGVYLGGVVGYGWGTTHALDDGSPSDGIKYDGVLGGIAIGYNKQFGNIVAGVEADFSASGLKGSGDGGTGWGCGTTDTCTFSTQWLGTARARVGYAVENFLPYVTGGLAIGRVKGELSGFCPGDEWCGSDTKTGWTAGGGLEWAFNQNWSAKAEYLYTDLGTGHFGTGNGGDGFEAKFKFNTVRFGVNYHF
ncbi:outer membrane protein [Mesorhizobium sp. 128a]